jgi:flagellar biosynthesis protein FlhF
MSDNALRDKLPIKKIQCATYDECIRKLREQYGQNFSPVERKEIPIGGWKRLFSSKTQCEVSYYEVNLSQPRQQTQNFRDTNAGAGAGIEQQKKQIIEIAGKSINPSSSNHASAEILEKLKEIDTKVNTLAQKGETPGIHPEVQKTKEFLEANEFSSTIIKQISQKLEKELSFEELNDSEIVQGKVVNWINELITIQKQPENPKKPRVIVLVGPTGEGKTTTIAKFAADNRKKYTGDNEQKICMVTIDQFRVAAGKQVETYAELLGAKFESAASADDIRSIAAKKLDIDLLLIDTAGYSPRDFKNIGQMRQILDIPELRPEIYLTVSASKTASSIMEICKNYETFDYKAVIVTKMDEAGRIGNVISVLAEKNKSVAYITTGQKVSSDIKEAESVDFLQKLTDITIRGEQNG